MIAFKQLDYALDRVTPMRWLVTKIVEGGDSPPSLEELAAQYKDGMPGDISRVIRHESPTNEREANAWIIHTAFELLDGQVEEVEGHLRLTVPVEDLKSYDGQKLQLYKSDPSPWPGGRDPFNPNIGNFRDNLRTIRPLGDLTELEESMREFGWLEEFPALQDERGVTIVGHRRLAVAEKIGIPPKIKVLNLGLGDAADAYRFKLALASNIGFKEMTPEERKTISEYLYGERGWVMERIGMALNVSTATVARDLADFSHDEKNRIAKDGTHRGRPKKEPRPIPEPPIVNLSPEKRQKLKEKVDNGAGEVTIAKAVGLKKDDDTGHTSPAGRSLRDAETLMRLQRAELEADPAQREAIARLEAKGLL